jgi:hypothetical protein
MAKRSNNVLSRVGVEPEARLRWLLRFGNLDLDSLTVEQGAVALQEARAFVFLQGLDPPLRARMRFWPPPIDATPNVLTRDEAWLAQRWLKQGLDLIEPGQEVEFRAARHIRARCPQGFVLGPSAGRLSFAAIQSSGVRRLP